MYDDTTKKEPVGISLPMGSFLFCVVFFGMKLAKIVLIAIALTVENVALMFHLGFIHWA